MEHATIKIDKFTIPLIGIPKDATLDECDLCHDFFSIQDLKLDKTGKFLYCPKHQD
jgi:hypothetical protein